MKTPDSLVPVMDCGIIQEVVRPLMSGKEAQVYVVLAGGRECVAKVYKEASQRTFKHRAAYTEGRRTRNTRDQRAMAKRSRHGKSQDEAGWRSTEVDMMFRLREAGVRVPELINSLDGVVVMEFVKDAEGDPAPRLGDLSFSASEARTIYRGLLREVSRMLCAGVIHGDLSEFNVLMGADGPVLIDFPQSIEASRNQSARKFLLRDVQNLHRFVERYAPKERRRPYAEEMWALYETNRLSPDTELRGDYRTPGKKTDTGEVMALIADADRDESRRREARGEELPEPTLPPRRKVVDFTSPRKPAAKKPAARRLDATESTPKRRNRRRRKKTTSAPTADNRSRRPSKPTKPAEKKTTSTDEAKPANRRRRARRPRSAKGASETKPGVEPSSGGGAADRPRRRRRRPRSTTPRDPS